MWRRLAASAQAATGGSRQGSKRTLAQAAMAVAAGGLVGATAFAGLVAYEVGTRLYEEREDLSGAVSLEEWMQLEAQGDVRAALRAVAARGLAQKARFQAWRFLLGVAPLGEAREVREVAEAQLMADLLVTRQVQARSSEAAASEARIIALDATRTRDGTRAAALNVSEARYAEMVDGDEGETARHEAFSGVVERVLSAYAGSDAETGYCQGMSDLLTPFLAAMPGDEASALACFRAMMTEPPLLPAARDAFSRTGEGMRAMLARLDAVLERADPTLHETLTRNGACPQCFFAFKMALVRCRRDFSVEDTCRLWECVWATDRLAAMDYDAQRSNGGGEEPVDANGPPESLLVYVLAAAVVWRRGELLDAEGHDDVVRLFGDASRREADDTLPQMPGLGALLRRARRLRARVEGPSDGELEDGGESE